MSLDGLCHEAVDSSISQNIFPYLKMQCKINITVEDNKKRMNRTNFINIYIQIYKPILYVKRMARNKNDSVNSTTQHSRVVNKNCCVVLPASGFPYLTLCPRQCKWKVATTDLAIRTKYN